ncbi:unnamed protein product, partial [Brenthis ino]
MAAKLVVALACIALCNSTPVFLNGYLFRDGRGYSIGQGYTNHGGQATGSASINGGVLHASGTATSNEQNPLIRNYGYEAYPGQAVAKAEVHDTQHIPFYGSAKAVADVHNVPSYYVPAPATVVAYEQNFDVPSQIRYEIPVGGVVAESSATNDGNSETSVSSVRTDGSGSAESSANTNGASNVGVTSSNAKTYGGIGSAISTANNAHGVGITATRTQGFGSAASKSQNNFGQVSAASQTNGGYASSSANNNLDSAVANADSQGYGSASSNADINNSHEYVISAAKNFPARGIHWRFGTAYGTPSGQVRAASQANGGSAKSSAESNGFGSIRTVADTQGQGSANANANLNGAGYFNSVANSNGLGGSAKSSANTNEYEQAIPVYSNGIGNVKSTANIYGPGYGNANAHADVDAAGHGFVSSAAKGYGSANSIANGPAYGALRVDGHAPYLRGSSHLNANAQTTGQGSATSSARNQGLNTAYRVVNSAANTYGVGSANANASA